MKLQTRLATLFLMGVLGAPAATLTYLGRDYSRGNVTSYNVNGSDRTTYAGVMRILIDETDERIAFCVDNFVGIGPTLHTTHYGEPSSISNGERIAWLIQEFSGLINAPILGMGLQLAIWDIRHDGGDGLNAGIFRGVANPDTAQQAIYDQAAWYIAQSLGMTSPDGIVYFNTRMSDGTPAQTLMGPELPNDVQTPEPDTLVMLGMGALMMALGRLRHRASV